MRRPKRLVTNTYCSSNVMQCIFNSSPTLQNGVPIKSNVDLCRRCVGVRSRMCVAAPSGAAVAVVAADEKRNENGSESGG